MKTKEEILKMNKEELQNYNWNDNLNNEVNINCIDCRDCIYCIDCLDCRDCAYSINSIDCRDCAYSINSIDCRDCIYCRNIKNKKYCICNVQLTKEEYEKKIKELEEQK